MSNELDEADKLAGEIEEYLYAKHPMPNDGLFKAMTTIRSLVTRVRAAEKNHDTAQSQARIANTALGMAKSALAASQAREAGVREEASDLSKKWIAAQCTEIALRAALGATLEYERQRAKSAGFSDCTCINYSREAENAYEAGRCPHQIARQALATPSPDPVDALVKAAREVCAGTEPQMQASDDYHWVEFIEPRLERLRSALQPFLEKSDG